MKIILLSLVIFVAIGTLSVLKMLTIKNKHKKLNKFADEIGDNLIKSGTDKYYKSFNTEELLDIYKELNNLSNTIDFKKDLYGWTEVACKAKLIEDILATRGITIPNI